MNNKALIIVCLIIVAIAVGCTFILLNNDAETVEENITMNNTTNETLNDTADDIENSDNSNNAKSGNEEKSTGKQPLTYCSECGAPLYDSPMCESCNAKARQKYYDAVANGEDTSFSEPKPVGEL